MKVFQNQTTDGNEEAIRRGIVVPSDAVNLAWAKSPEVTPAQNIVIVDTSRIVGEDILAPATLGLYYSNTLGVLEDIQGNQLIQDQFPAVTDQLTISGNLTHVDLTTEDILPYVHISRFFHLDFLGITMGSGLTPYTTSTIKIVDDNGRNYVDANGNLRYKIKVAPAYVTSAFGHQSPYRVWAYVDTDTIGGTSKNLYLTYDKVEIRVDGSYQKQVINYKELLNPQPVFSYRPEDAEVADPNNREQTWYSTRPVSLKSQALGLSVGNINGFNVFVPKKAINDPRIFQLFRWRATCNFTNSLTVATTVDKPIRCGVIITNSDPVSVAAQVFNVIQSTGVNTNEAVFANPLSVGQSITERVDDAYWYVNFDTVTYSELIQFDLLLWAPNSPLFDFTDYLGKIKYFTETLGRVLVIDTENNMVPVGLGITTTSGVSAHTGVASSPYGTAGSGAVTGPAWEIAGTFPGLYNNIRINNPSSGTVISPPILPPDDSASAFSGVLYNRIGEPPLPPTATAGGQISIGPRNFSNSFSFFDAESLNGWLIRNIDPISELQTIFGAAGGFTQYITDMPQMAQPIGFKTDPANTTLSVPLILANKVTLQQYTQSVAIPGQAYTLTYYTSTTQFHNISGLNVFAQGTPRPPGSGIGLVGNAGENSIIAVSPTVPAGGIFDRVELYQETLWLSGSNSTIITWLNGPGFDALAHTSTVPANLPGAYGALNNFDSTTNPLSPGGAFQLSWGVIATGNLGYTQLTQQQLTATTYYHVTTTVAHTTVITPTTVYTYTVPTFTPVPVVAQVGNLIFSTFNLFSSAVHKLAGAQEFLYNIALYATSNRSLYDFKDKTYSSSFSFSSPWTLSWAINATDNQSVLSAEEKAKYNFVFIPEDVATPTPIWQRQLSASTIKQLIDEAMSPEMAQKVAGSTREYSIEVTNSQVQVPTTLTDQSLPYAWTKAYSPPFIVPPDFPTYVVREKEIPGNYEAGQYIYRTYPDKPYNLQVQSIFDDNFDLSTNDTVTWVATGTALETYDTATLPDGVTKIVPVVSPYWTPVLTEVELSWWDNTARAYSVAGLNPYAGALEPTGIVTWQEVNQRLNFIDPSFSNGQLNWPFWGLTGRYQLGSTGDVVSFIQDILNTLNYLTVSNTGGSTYRLPGGSCPIDGRYGTVTANAVRAFQAGIHAQFVDSIVDAETWALLGGQILRFNLHGAGRSWLSPTASGYYEWPYGRMRKEAISDGNPASVYAKRSWTTGGPSVIWDIIAVIFDQPYQIHAVNFTAYLEGNSPTMILDAVDVQSDWIPNDLFTFDAKRMMVKNLNMEVSDFNRVSIPVISTLGNCVMVCIGQNKTSFLPSSRMFGVRDITASAVVTRQVHNPPPNTMAQRTIEIDATGNSTLVSGHPVNIQVRPDYAGSGTLSNIAWHTVSVNNDNVSAFITNGGLVTLDDDAVLSLNTTGIVQGVPLPGNGSEVYYSLDGNGNIRPYAETGWISKADGLKLLCTKDGSPFLFSPDQLALPDHVASNEQRHYVNLSIVSSGTEPTVQVGFYDNARKEFVVNAAGNPEMPYVEYVARGPNNIYIGVISTYELDTTKSLPVFQSANGVSTPNTDDAPLLPHLLAMPVYGVATRPGSKISIEPIPANLGPDDIWPVAIRPGQFNRQVTVPVGATTYIAPYQGTVVTAFYAVPEAAVGGWSVLFGAPNVDIVGEEPIILDDNTIQVRQPPIVMVREPTANLGPADPVRPIFQVAQRSSLSQPWVDVPFNLIQDYNVGTGTIYLANGISVNDPTLLQVSYTSQRGNYYFKQFNGQKLNLNPYPGQPNPLVGQSIFIYVMPQYVVDANNVLIPTSVKTRTLGFTTDPGIFNPLLPAYDPLAIQLGIVYMSPAANVNDLVLLDSRRRGGGARDELSAREVQQLVSESLFYWDLNFGAGMSHQKGGFIIIRLPAELQQSYSESFVREVIERNLTAGVQYKLEDLQGNDWVG